MVQRFCTRSTFVMEAKAQIVASFNNLKTTFPRNTTLALLPIFRTKLNHPSLPLSKMAITVDRLSTNIARLKLRLSRTRMAARTVCVHMTYPSARMLHVNISLPQPWRSVFSVNMSLGKNFRRRWEITYIRSKPAMWETQTQTVASLRVLTALVLLRHLRTKLTHPSLPLSKMALTAKRSEKIAPPKLLLSWMAAIYATVTHIPYPSARSIFVNIKLL
jgi:hypothetical protein